MKRKWQRVLSWVLTLTMLLGTFGDAGFKVFAADDDAAEAVAEATTAEDEADPEVPDEDPDSYTWDSKLNFAFDGSHAKIAIPNGSFEDWWAGEHWYTNNEKRYDSKYGITIYVVPDLGYTFGKDATAWANNLKISGGWWVKDAEAPVEDITSAYTVELVSMDVSDTDTQENWYDDWEEDGYNWKTALKVTFAPGTDLAKAFETAWDGTVEYEDYPTVTIAPKAVADTLPVYYYEPKSTTAKKVAGVATFDAVYGADKSVVLRNLDDNPTWGIAGVAIVKGIDEDGDLIIDPYYYRAYDENIAGYDFDYDEYAYALFDDVVVEGQDVVTNIFQINAEGINVAYKEIFLHPEYKLAIIFYDDPAKTVTLTGLESDYWKVECVGDQEDDAFGTVPMGGNGNYEIKVTMPKNPSTADRLLEGVYYQVGDDDEVKATKKAETDDIYLVPKADVVKDTIVYAKTLDYIAFSVKEAGTADVAFAPGDVQTIDEKEYALTNGSVKFRAIAKDGYKIKEIYARIWNIASDYTQNTSYTDYILGEDTTGTIIDNGRGVFEVTNVKGNCVIFVETEPMGHAFPVRLKEANDTMYAVSVADGIEITTNDGPMAEKDVDFTFEIMPDLGYSVKTLSYTVGDSDVANVIIGTGATDAAGVAEMDSHGLYTVTIPGAKVQGAIALTIVEAPEAAWLYKMPNNKAVVTIDDVVVADKYNGGLDYIVVDSTKTVDITVTPSGNNVTVSKVYFGTVNPLVVDGNGKILEEESIANLKTAITTEKLILLESASNTYSVTRDTIRAFYNYKVEEGELVSYDPVPLYVVVLTEEEATGYETIWVEDDYTIFDQNDDIAKYNDIIDEVVLVAGGKNDPVSGAKGVNNLEAIFVPENFAELYKAGQRWFLHYADTFELTEGKVVGLPDGKTSIEDETVTIQSVYKPNVKNKYPTGEDTLTGKYSSGFPHAVAYKDDIPVTVNDMASFYDADKLGFKSVVTQRAGDAGLPEDGMFIRAYDDDFYGKNPKVAADDSIKLTPVYGDKEFHYNHQDYNNYLVDQLVWNAVNDKNVKYDSTVIDPDYYLANAYDSYRPNDVYVNGTNWDYINIGGAKTAMTIDVTATITFDDGTFIEIPDTVTVLPTEMGYYAIPVIKFAGFDPEIGRNEEYYYLDLEVSDARNLNTAEIKYYVVNIGDVMNAEEQWDHEPTMAEMIALLEKYAISSVEWSDLTSVIYDYNKEKYVSGQEYVSVSGSNGAGTITALKELYGRSEDTDIREYAIVGTEAKVGDYPVRVMPIRVYTYDELSSLTVTLATDSEYSGKESYDDGKNYAAPELKDDAAWLQRDHGTTIDDRTKTEIGYVYYNVAESEKFTLPVESDFDPVTFDSSKTLWGWEVVAYEYGTGGFEPDGAYYAAPGAEIQVENYWDNLYISAIWVDRYTDVDAIFKATEATVKEVVESNVVGSNPGKLEIAKDATMEIAMRLDPVDFAATWDPTSEDYIGKDNVNPENPARKYVITQNNLTLTSNDPEDAVFSIDGCTVKGLNKAIGQLPILTITYAENAGQVYELKYVESRDKNKPYYVDVINPNDYVLTADTINIEVTQIKDFAVDFTLDDVSIALNDPKFFANDDVTKNVKLTLANEELAEVSLNDPEQVDDVWVNSLHVVGLKEGSTTLTLTVTDKFGTVIVSDPITINVKPATIRIAPVGDDKIEGNMFKFDADYGFLVKPGKGNQDIALELVKNDNGARVFVQNWEVEATTDNDEKVKDSYVKASAAIAGEGNDPAILSVTATEDFGTGSVRVYASYNDSIYYIDYDVTSYYTWTYPGSLDDELYTVYNGSTALSNVETEIKKVIYTGAKEYTVAGSDAMKAKWTEEDYVDYYSFVGWVYVPSSYYVEDYEDLLDDYLDWGLIFEVRDCNYLAGEKITLPVEDIIGYGDSVLLPIFSNPEISITGAPKQIVLTDEKLTTAVVAGTDKKAVTIAVTPAKSNAEVTIGAANTRMLTLEEGNTTDAPVVVYPADGYDPIFMSEDDELEDFGNGNRDRQTRTVTFTIGKLDEELNLPADGDFRLVGTTSIIIRYNYGFDDNGDPIYDEETIPVYVNGAYIDELGVERYLENGANLEEGARTVKGVVHYYKDGVRCIKGVVNVDGKLILVIDGIWMQEPGVYALDDDLYYVGKDGYVKNNGLFNGETEDDADKTYFANEDGTLFKGDLKEIDGKTYYFNGSGVMEKADATANEYAPTSDGKYYVNVSGNVAIKGLFKVDGINRLFREDGTIVVYTDADVVDGKITVGGLTYVIDPKTNEATLDDVLYNPTVNWTTTWPVKWNKGSEYPTMTYTITYTSAKSGATATTDPVTVKATSDPAEIPQDAEKVTFSVSANLYGYFDDAEGTTPAKDVVNSQTYTFANGGAEGLSGVYTYKSHEFMWAATIAEGADKPVVSANVTYSVTVNNEAQPDVTMDVPVNVTKNEAKSDAKKTVFSASINLLDGSVKTDEKAYSTKDGSLISKPEIDVLGGAYTVIGVEEEYAYAGTRLKPAIRVIDNERGVELGNGTDYTVKYTGKNKIGETNTVNIKGKGNYAGTNAEVTFKIVDPKTLVEGEDLAAKVKSIKKIEGAFTYNGEAQYPASITVKTDGGEIVFTHDGDGEYSTESTKTVALTVYNNENKGTAVVSATGADGKTKKKTFKIKPADISGAKFEADEAVWGAKASEVTVSGTFGEEDLELVAGGDFKVKYTAKTAGEATGTAKITGKGNFKGKNSVSYKVDALDLSEANIIVDAAKANKVKVTVTDKEGNKIAKKLYTVATESGEGEVTVTVTPSDKAAGNITGEATATASAGKTKLGKVKVNKSFSKTFTGEAIELSEEDFAAGKIEVGTLAVGTDFEIVSYNKNIKKGKMSVTIQGIGDYSGVKTFKVKIVGKPLGN